MVVEVPEGDAAAQRFNAEHLTEAVAQVGLGPIGEGEGKMR